MQLKRYSTRSDTPKPYFRWVLHPPKEIIELLGWENGDEVLARVQDGNLVLSRVDPHAKERAQSRTRKREPASGR